LIYGLWFEIFIYALPNETVGANCTRAGGNSHMADSVVVKAKIKEIATGYNVAGDFADALDRKVREMIKTAVKRAEGNGRKTVMAKDL
jgi:hypothetical protein